MSTTHDCRALLEPSGYNDKTFSTTYKARVQIAGAENGFTGYGICFIPKGAEGRQVFQGPMVPGPWASTFGLATVIAAGGRGTGYDVEQGKLAGQVIEAEPGDRLVLDTDTVVEITLDRYRYPVLTVVEG